jgi:hypothetical protein
MNMDMELEHFFANYLIWCNSPYSAVRAAAGISQCNFQWHYVLLAPLRDERMTQKFIPQLELLSNDVSVELERSYGVKKCHYQRYVQ